MFMTTRRALMAGSALLFAAMPASAQSFLDVGEQEPIPILINASPWYGGFEAVVDLYVEQTGNEVAIDATPYNGVLEKARNAIRSAESPYDIINLDQSWNIEFYEQDVLRPLDEVVAGLRDAARGRRPAATATSGTPRSTSARRTAAS